MPLVEASGFFALGKLPPFILSCQPFPSFPSRCFHQKTKYDILNNENANNQLEGI